MLKDKMMEEMEKGSALVPIDLIAVNILLVYFEKNKLNVVRGIINEREVCITRTDMLNIKKSIDKAPDDWQSKTHTFINFEGRNWKSNLLDLKLAITIDILYCCFEFFIENIDCNVLNFNV